MADSKVTEKKVPGSTYGIYYEAKTQKDYENIKMTKDDKGVITIWGDNTDFYLPENEASKIIFKGNNSRIRDGRETDGNKYQDEIYLNGERNTYKTSESKNGADLVEIAGKTNMVELLGKGNTAIFTKKANLPMVVENNEGNTVKASPDVSKDQLSLWITPDDPKFNNKIKAMKDLLEGTLQRKTSALGPFYQQKSLKKQTLTDLGTTYIPSKVAGKTDMIVTGVVGDESKIWTNQGSPYCYTIEGSKKVDDYLLTKTSK